MSKEQDKQLLKAFFANPQMADAVRRALIDEDTADAKLISDISRAIDDAEYGRKVKVWLEARLLVERRFNDLKRGASSNPQADPVNEAR